MIRGEWKAAKRDPRGQRSARTVAVPAALAAATDSTGSAKGGLTMRRDAPDPAPEPGKRGPGPAPARVGRARRFRVNYGLAALIGVAMMGLS
jgi:hypothetical protein